MLCPVLTTYSGCFCAELKKLFILFFFWGGGVEGGGAGEKSTLSRAVIQMNNFFLFCLKNMFWYSLELPRVPTMNK